MPSLHAVAVRLATLLVPLSVVLSAYLYLYPFAHRCGFPTPPAESQKWLDGCAFQDDALSQCYRRRDVAPFRLLALGDPQLEGDTSLPEEVEKKFLGFTQLQQDVLDRRWNVVTLALRNAFDDTQAEIVRRFKYARKNLDLLGNDYYLAHIYRTLQWATEPTHVTVLGDLLGSQWIDDEEFEDRAQRFWKRIFNGAEVVPNGLLPDYATENRTEQVQQILGEDKAWSRRIINVAGNHDIGYGGDIERSRITRFEKAFGPVNGDVWFTLPTKQCNASNDRAPKLRLVLLNSMNLDGPVFEEELQQETYRFVNSIIERSDSVGDYNTATILLTHIPLHKEPGICVDSPYFSYFADDNGGGVEEQNMLSKDISLGATLQGIFGKSSDFENAAAAGVGRDGIILTGHDHEGCDVYHHVNSTDGQWIASKYGSSEAITAEQDATTPGLREVTVRSMMGEFGGNAALVSAWWDDRQGKWQIEVEMCSLGVQHIWWAIHILDLAAIVAFMVAGLTWVVDGKVHMQKKAGTTQSVGSRVLPKENGKAVPSPRRASTTSPSRSKKQSAFARRMQQSVEDTHIDGLSDSDARE